MNNPVVVAATQVLSYAACNTFAALLLSLVIYAISRVWRNPPVTNALWVLLMLKLMAPPLFRLEWVPPLPIEPKPAVQWTILEDSTLEEHNIAVEADVVTTGTPTSSIAAASTLAGRPELPSVFHQINRFGPLILMGIWFIGSLTCALTALIRIVLFERQLRNTLPASFRLRQLAVEAAERIGVRQIPDLRISVVIDSPLVWWAGRRPTIVLPMHLVSALDEKDLTLIVAHELAHLKRHDHWVRGIELIVATVYWWNPLLWIVRRQIHESEELCCDAWVCWAFPDCAKRYSEVLFQSAQSMGASRVHAPLLPASPLLRSVSLKARIEMILERRFSPHVSARTAITLGLLAALVLPAFLATTRGKAQAESNDDTPATTVEPASKSDFPIAVKFEQGVTDFLEGDTIVVQEIHGTTDTFLPGNSYRIKGTYKLTSHDRAVLAAYTTAMDSKDGTSQTQPIQQAEVKQGVGIFTLVLPMSCRGWPHISFYPAEGGSSFGGNYFGTGESVLKRAWRKPDGNPQTELFKRILIGTQSTVASATAKSEFPHAVAFEQGATRFQKNDKITILEVRGTSDTFAPGNIYWIRGTYALDSHDKAQLGAYTTSMESGQPNHSTIKVQTAEVARGEGAFTLFLPMFGKGLPHVSFYPLEGGESFGGNYFGTGDSVLKRWWD